ncbi:hypothetical protein [Thermococcus sp. GR4]|uniref:hypothetical protein n=1 Tax=Thermococcus sp. GR4 TaxID=1638254 RepID=UPI00197CB7C6|nr:hypothetical protein [Thermococcus sp. GR4]
MEGEILNFAQVERIRIEAELKERPKEVFLKMGEKRKPLKPLIESVDREMLFLLYRKES